MNALQNKLPLSVRWRYGVIYSEQVTEQHTIFRDSKERWGVLKHRRLLGVLDHYDCIIKPEYLSVIFYPEYGRFGATLRETVTSGKATDTSMVFDLDGNLVFRSPAGMTIRSNLSGGYITQSGRLHGLLDRDFATICEPVYNRLQSLNAAYFLARNDQGAGILNKNGNIVLQFDYHTIFDQVLNDRVVVGNADGYSVFDLKCGSLEKLDADLVLPATSNTYNAGAPGRRGIYKTVTGHVGDEWQHLEMLQHRGKWGIIRADGIEIIPNKYEYVDCLRAHGFFKVCLGELDVLCEEAGQDDELLLTAVHGGKWGIVDAANRVVVPIQYDWIEEIGPMLWAVYEGGEVFYNDDYQEEYWTVRGGTLGVYNGPKLIVPVEYSAIDLSWFQVRDYIFVQRGNPSFDAGTSDFDVFTFDGEQVIINKPMPRNHRNSG